MSSSEINVGDEVTVGSSTQKMMVWKINDGKAYCEWMTPAGKKEEDAFAVTSLRKVPPGGGYGSSPVRMG